MAASTAGHIWFWSGLSCSTTFTTSTLTSVSAFSPSALGKSVSAADVSGGDGVCWADGICAYANGAVTNRAVNPATTTFRIGNLLKGVPCTAYQALTLV